MVTDIQEYVYDPATRRFQLQILGQFYVVKQPFLSSSVH